MKIIKILTAISVGFLFMLFCRLDLSAQCINDDGLQIKPDSIVVWSGTLYRKNGNELIRLRGEDIRHLEAYGFDYECYRMLRTHYSVGLVIEIAGLILLPLGGFIGRKGDHTILSTGMIICSPVLSFSGVEMKRKAEGQLYDMTNDMNDSSQLGFKSSGYGIIFRF